MIVKVDESNYYKRIDKFLKNQFRDMPLSAVFSFLRKGKVKVNQKRVKKPDYEILIGDSIEVFGYCEHSTPTENRNNQVLKFDFEILFEDDFILVINKPYNMSSHGGTNIKNFTVIDALTANSLNFTPFLVHRLDKYTSGVMVVAKGRDMARKLSAMFSSNNVEKKYLSMVVGNISQSGVIKSDIEAKDACTSYKKLKSFDLGNNLLLSEVEVSTKTGRKHQIRKHLSSIGHPVLGDDLYGNWDINKKVKSDIVFKGYMLQCFFLKFVHPETKETVKVVVEPDDRFSGFHIKIRQEMT